jgi:hypothetical protein
MLFDQPLRTGRSPGQQVFYEVYGIPGAADLYVPDLLSWRLRANSVESPRWRESQTPCVFPLARARPLKARRPTDPDDHNPT